MKNINTQSKMGNCCSCVSDDTKRLKKQMSKKVFRTTWGFVTIPTLVKYFADENDVTMKEVLTENDIKYSDTYLIFHIRDKPEKRLEIDLLKYLQDYTKFLEKYYPMINVHEKVSKHHNEVMQFYLNMSENNYM